jgi:hypothetical protein
MLPSKDIPLQLGFCAPGLCPNLLGQNVEMTS